MIRLGFCGRLQTTMGMLPVGGHNCSTIPKFPCWFDDIATASRNKPVFPAAVRLGV